MNFCFSSLGLLFPTNTPLFPFDISAMPASEALGALRWLSRGPKGLLLGPEAVTV